MPTPFLHPVTVQEALVRELASNEMDARLAADRAACRASAASAALINARVRLAELRGDAKREDLTAEYEAWLNREGFTGSPMALEDLAASVEFTPAQALWADDFSNRWEATYNV